MSSQEKIKLKIPTARSKLQSSFPQDLRGDIKIILNKKYAYKLQKAFLRLQSNYFKKVFSPEINALQILEGFQESHFENILKCFYGFTVQIDRNDVLSYYKIIKYLQIECLLKFLREDMTKNVHRYELFILMRLGHQYNQQQIFDACFRELDRDSFQQLNYGRFQLLKSSQELFKLIIKTHNRTKAQTQKGLQYSEVDKIIKEFCSQKSMSESQYQEMKFELIDKNSLTSVEYKQIFLDQLKNMKKSNIVSQSFVKFPSNSYGFQNSGGGLNSLVKTSNLTQSMISQTQPTKNVSTELSLQMQNTFQKKLNQQLKIENDNLKRQIQALKQLSQKNQATNITLQNSLSKLQQNLNIKEEDDKKQKQLISRMEKAIVMMKSQLTQKSNIVQKLQQKIGKLQKNTNKKYMYDSDEQEQDDTIQSQIVPAHFLNQMMPNAPKQEQPNKVFKKKPPPTIQIQNIQPQKQDEEQIDDQDLEEMYGPRLAFSQQPTGTPKKYFPTLANFLTAQQGWNKKKLTLLYRRSQQGKSIGQSKDLRCRNSLLILIRTQYGQYIGGFISISLPKSTSGDYLQDRQAFLFSLSRNQKFQILKSQASQAIFMSESNLISFGNDLAIAENCLKQKSQSSWPSSYNQGKKNSRIQWFLGGPSPFLITQIECYEVQQAEMEMVL